jgi:hypothetical protein
MPLLLIKNILSYLDILPPLVGKKRGRPRVTRIRKGALKRKQTKCTNCLQLGHNKRRCVAQPAQNGRAKRLRDWNRDISSNSNLDKSIPEESSDSELEKELAPFVEQARARARAKAQPLLVRGLLALALLASPASPVLEPRPERAQKLPERYR